MRVRSTGLGKSEMQANIETLESREGYLILHLRATEPVLWHIRGAVYYGEVWKILLLLLRRGVVKYLLFGWIKKKGALNEF